MTRFVRWMPLLAAVAWFGGAATAPAAAPVCDPPAFPRDRDDVHLVATATAEMLRAGPGSMEYIVDPEGPDPDPASVQGQVMRVNRLGGAAAAGIPAGADRVVLVPWGYLYTCTLVRWDGGWVQPGARGLFWGTLRPREQWVNGLPTLDVTNAYDVPYLGNGLGVPDAEERAGPPLSADQVFEVAGLLPLGRDLQGDANAAWAPLLDWARAHPGLARRYPASVLVREASSGLRAERLARIRLPLAGTYRFTVSVDQGAPRTFYARTHLAPAYEWAPGRDYESQPVLDEPFLGYVLGAAGSTSGDSLPAERGPYADPERGGAFSVLAEPDAGPDGARIWRGTVDLGLVSRQFPHDSALAPIGAAAFERYYRRAQAREPEEIRATFLLRPDGSVTVEQVSVLDDGRVIFIRGERISTVTAPSR